QDGLEVNWYENGQKWSERNYKDGKFDGLQVAWHENGQKLQEGNWKEDKLDGLWLRWHENGQKKRVKHTYKDGKLVEGSGQVLEQQRRACRYIARSFKK
ncbi:MAG: toxin-antitoxin system YwqK family antitoxin, partial [Verrucomicrobiales bacterium]